MEVASKALVLRTTKISDTSVVVSLFTPGNGVEGFVVKGVFNQRQRSKRAALQPLSLVEIAYNRKETHNLQVLREIKLTRPFKQIHSNPIKTTIVLFLEELLLKVFADGPADEPAFAYIESALETLDEMADAVNFHLSFMLGLSRFLGFYPVIEKASTALFFDLYNGEFTHAKPDHPRYFDGETTAKLLQFATSPISASSDVLLTREQRKELLTGLIDYYQLHVAGMGKMNSPAILKEVLGGK